MSELLQQIASQNQLQFHSSRRLHGGDINEVFLLQCREGDYVIKLNHRHRYPDMFAAEAKGLQLLGSVEGVITPGVITTGHWQESSYLLLEYCPEGTPQDDFWKQFAQTLALLHRQSQEKFGLDHDNYIGCLPQRNGAHSNLISFYIQERLEPQFALAEQKGFVFSQRDRFYKKLDALLPEESPALIHGDLWNGNYLVSDRGMPILIDPAVCYGPREMDLAMMRLFGGFPQQVYEVYQELIPLAPGWEERIEIWQLYYLLVHLNLFGSSYLGQVQRIVDRYSKN